MKFQNPSFKFFLKGQTNKRTDGQAESNMLPTFFKVGGINFLNDPVHRQFKSLFIATKTNP